MISSKVYLTPKTKPTLSFMSLPKIILQKLPLHVLYCYTTFLNSMHTRDGQSQR